MVPEFPATASFMRRPCSILLLCVLLGFVADAAVPAEDVPETAYDESEGLPYEVIPLLSIVSRPVAARTPQPMLKSGPLSRRCEGHAEHRAWSAHPASNSLTILDHSLRC
jgi:hypothetical protein